MDYYQDWTLAYDIPLAETTANSVEELKNLFANVRSTDVAEPDKRKLDTWRTRLAPSIITRGEAEMIGLSDPRFARRIILKDEGKIVGLVNLRRLLRLYDQSRTVCLASHLHRVSSIGDSLFCAPNRFLEKGWHVLGIPETILVLYGEPDLVFGPSKTAIPFMKHLHIAGGGLCAQACCWMATMYLNRWTHRILSIPEITSVARGCPVGWMELRGLNLEEVTSFFNDKERTRLSSRIQLVPWKGIGDVPSVSTNLLRLAVKSYIRAGFPIIAPVDSERMGARKPLCSTTKPENAYQHAGVIERIPASQHKIPKNLRHLILVYGCSPDADEILFSDPGHLPIMDMKTSGLLTNACYQIPRTNDGFPLGAKLSTGMILPVTPGLVQMPLLDYRYDKLPDDAFTQRPKASSKPGLFTISGLLDPTIFFPHWHGPVFNFINEPFYLLCRLRDLFESHSDDCGASLKHVPNQLQHEIADHVSNLERQGWNSNCWIWLEVKVDRICVWDAQADTNAFDLSVENHALFLISIGCLHENKIIWRSIKTAPPPKPSPPISNLTSRPIPIDGSIITSFDQGGLTQAIACLSNISTSRKVFLDVYTFMVADRQHFLDGMRLSKLSIRHVLARLGSNLRKHVTHLAHTFPIRFDWNRVHAHRSPVYKSNFRRERFVWPDCNVSEWLAAIADDDTCIAAVAQRLLKSVSTYGTCSVFSTFFPNLTSLDPDLRKESIAALRCIVKIAKVYNTLKSHNDVTIIEIVGGGLIGDHRINNRNKTDATEFESDVKRLEAFILTKDAAHDSIIKALENVVANGVDGLRFALELEPGPLFAVADWSDLVKLNRKLKASPILDGVVGYNCDVGHWHLAGITPKLIHDDINKDRDEKFDSVAERIIHCHVSDFHNGHFADLVPGIFNGASFLSEWLTTVDLAYTCSRNKFPGPRYVSIELELAASQRIVQEALTVCAKTLTTSPLPSAMVSSKTKILSVNN